MNRKYERQQDILKLITDVDITPSMFKNAESKYKALSDYLGRHTELNTNMYAQGSFALGTVVRPIKDGKDADYDLDFICEVNRDREEISASELRSIIEKALSDVELYGGKMEAFDECITIHYAEENGVGFSIDIVPAVHESWKTKKRLAGKTNRLDLIEESIAIPMGAKGRYEWHTNNPKGFKKWFDEINKPFLEYSKSNERKVIFETAGFYNTVEEIPEGMLHSSVQRVIQILKRNRNLFYQKFYDLKPNSAIINVIVAKVASECNSDIGVFDLLERVFVELSESNRNYNNIQYGDAIWGSRIVSKRDKNWYIANPANPEDNLADKWNEDPRIADKFFLWVEAARKDLIDSLELEDAEFRAILESAFGQAAVQNTLKEKYGAESATPITGVSKPWRNR